MLPTEPNTPPSSMVWKVVHFPLVLLAIGLAFMVAAGALSGLVSGVLQRIEPDGNGPMGAVLGAAVAAVFTGAYLAFVWLVERRRPTAFGLKGWARELGAGLLIGFLIFSAIVGVIALFGGYRVVGTRGPEVLWPVLGIALISGFTEEIIMRGLIFRLIERWLGSWIALAMSAALFGVGHLANPNASWLAAICIALEAGIMLGAIYMVTRRLWAAIGIHAAWNFTQGGIYGIAISGLDTKGLLVPRITGPDLLTGGAFGAEASLPALVLATALGVALLVIAHRRGNIVAPFWARQSTPAESIATA
ncbi:CPBP family intramembrane glutamic endopeptidase [Hephaestia sp. GCM10023244]|uniref:CPBP family intramembrane glutamic endopeptidase n=1 Tax=unclassified Hephaestia TaxID=2631281 RepID=UPI00207764D7|nr:type II CAAX endopeptidase family protein [Hephaestia sp. MAHUQ-44]MCM8729629.1 CPBP family intramembrane metalloprotease [Hephaestia sp. MAHUQ-44]